MMQFHNELPRHEIGESKTQRGVTLQKAKKHLPFFNKRCLLALSFFTVVSFGSVKAQTYTAMSCGNKVNGGTGNENLGAKPSPTASCGRQSAVYSSFFVKKESFIPLGTVKPETVIKKIKLRFMIANPMTAQKNNYDPASPADMVKLQFLVNALNSANQTPTAPTGAPGSCTNCTVPDNRIRYELAGVTTFNSRSFYFPGDVAPDFTSNVMNGDRELNIFLAYFPNAGGGPESWAGITNPRTADITRFDFYSDPKKDYIVLSNVYQSYPSEWEGNIIANAIHHELFHEYGFWHIEGQNGTETCNETASDYLGDLFGTGAQKYCPLDNTRTCNNVMVGGRNTTPLQLGIIHRELFMGRMHKYAYPTESPTQHIWVVNSNQTWDFPIRMFQTIRVMPGATLTIKCEVQMPENSNIIVELGGKLVLDGGTITSYNSKSSWGGLQIKGNEQQVALSQYQGTLEMKNGSVIENAWEGVWNYSPENYFQQGGGGIILAENSKFYNCNKAVDLAGYQTYSYTYSGSSKCSFKKMEFTIDENSPFFSYYQQAGYEYFTTDRIRAGVELKNCTFKNNLDYSYQWTGRRGRALRIFETGALITGCSFDGFIFAVKTEGYTGNSRTTTILNNTFTRNSENIMVAAAGFTSIRGNNISKIVNSDTGQNGQHKYFPGSAVFLDDAKGAYVGCGNVIDGLEYMVSYPYSVERDSKDRRGIVIQNSNTFGGTVTDNTINKIAIGTQTQKRNPLLNIACNQYYKNKVAWQVNPQSNSLMYTLNNQGTGIQPFNTRAGNVFKTNDRDIYNYLGSDWKYYAYGTDLFQIPVLNYNMNGRLNISNFSGTSGNDPNSQCEGLRPSSNILLSACNIMPWSGTLQHTVLGQYLQQVAIGEKWSADGRFLFGQMVTSYHELDDMPGLQSFLENEDDDNARRLLIPMYIDNEDYANVWSTITTLAISKEEQLGYQDYYTLLANLKKDKRDLHTISETEWITITTLAHQDLEVSPYAKALLDVTGREEWIHEIEEPDANMQTMAHKTAGLPEITTPAASMLYNAAPNPVALGKTQIQVYITEQDADKAPQLRITNLLGKQIAVYRLEQGLHTIELNTSAFGSGMYYYSLFIGGQTKTSKKLIVNK